MCSGYFYDPAVEEKHFPQNNSRHLGNRLLITDHVWELFYNRLTPNNRIIFVIADKKSKTNYFQRINIIMQQTMLEHVFTPMIQPITILSFCCSFVYVYACLYTYRAVKYTKCLNLGAFDRGCSQTQVHM